MTVRADRAFSPAAGAQRWPDVRRLPGGRARLRCALVAATVQPGGTKLGVRVQYPDGRFKGSHDPQAPVLRLHRPADMYRRVVAGGMIGFGESYQAGDWDADDLPGLLEPMARRALNPPRFLKALRRAYRVRRPRSEAATLSGARSNAHRHYDLSNEFFALFLDETMTYSSALFTGDGSLPRPDDRRLAEAQRRKINRVLDLAGVRSGSSLLEIGTGWGELTIMAARRGAYVHTITLSEQQRALAQTRIEATGLADQVRLEMRDYRNLGPAPTGGYDAIISVEMIEAVDEAHWPAYFEVLERNLARGGRIVLQAITMRHEHLLAARDRHTWIHKYVFPGGQIPSLKAIESVCCGQTRLVVRDASSFGAHYAHTLRLWRERFRERADDVLALGFDETFCRTWNMYLAVSEAGFASGYLDVHHLSLERPGD